MVWTPHGSDADYWRSDNPLIKAWYKFGDEPSSSVERALTRGDPTFFESHSGMLMDSSRGLHHLMYRGVTITNQINPVSGIPSWSISGVQFGGAAWLDTGSSAAFWADPHSFRHGSSTSAGFEPYAMGRETTNSGLTVMGWANIPQLSVNPTVVRNIFGTHEDLVALGASSPWSVRWKPDTRRIQFRFLWATEAAEHILDTTDWPYPPNYGEDFFVACQLTREQDIPGGFTQEQHGSGIARIFLGTQNSGLMLAAEVGWTDTAGFAFAPAVRNRLSFANNATSSRLPQTSTAILPPSSILDEWIIVQDGLMEPIRIAHYMNSGVNHITTSDPHHDDFEPVLAGSLDLAAYWTFDDNTGTNSAPDTVNTADVIFDTALGLGAVPGVHGGSGIRPGRSIWDEQTVADFPHVPIGGANEGLIFPDINSSKQWTWIGWLKTAVTGSTDHGGIFGIQEDEGTNRQAFVWGKNNNETGTTLGRAMDGGVRFLPSGNDIETNTVLAPAATNSDGNQQGPHPGRWQLWALQIDFDVGYMKIYRDANKGMLHSTMFSTVSGFDRTPFDAGGALVFSAQNDDAIARRCEFDDWAIYRRLLSIPEMSGYALSGITGSALPISPISTNLKQTLGYWVFNEENTVLFDPTGTSGTYYGDLGWYRHHLSQTSGNVSIEATTINIRIDDTALQVNASGSTVGVSRLDIGANADFSNSNIRSSSGMTVGCWMQIPSGDLETEGNGSSGMFGDHHVMGCWSQDIEESHGN